MSAFLPLSLAPCGAFLPSSFPEGGAGGEGSRLPDDFASGASPPSSAFPAGAGDLLPDSPDASSLPASSASSTRITLPSETWSPSDTFTSLTVQAAVDGTSMVALCDSSVIRPCSFSTLSPAETITSITGTLSMPISGTLTSIVFAMLASLHQRPTQIAQHLGQVGGKARGRGAVDDAMVVRQRQRQHQPRHELAAVPDRLHAVARDAQDGHFRRIDDGRELGAADAAQRRNGNAAAGHVGRTELLVAGLDRNLAQLLGQFDQPLLVAIADHRHHQAVRRVHGDADVEILLEDQLFAGRVQRGIELRELLQRRDHGLDLEHQRRDLDVRVFLAELLAEGFQLGDVGVVMLGDVRDHRPVARQVGAGNLDRKSTRLNSSHVAISYAV